MSVEENSLLQVVIANSLNFPPRGETCETQVQVFDNKRLAGGHKVIRTIDSRYSPPMT